MSTGGGGLRELVRETRRHWQEGRAAIRQGHDEGAPGRKTTGLLSDLLDGTLLRLHHAIVAELDPAIDGRVSLVLHGGCGRREVAPGSDVDLMVLYQGSGGEVLREYTRRLAQDINDTGPRVAISLRTTREACTLALRDPQVFSTLTEGRFLAGNLDLTTSFAARLQRLGQKNYHAVAQGMIDARSAERAEFGETVYLLRPNIKRSPGALRDIHLVRWLGYLRAGESDIDQLVRQGALRAAEAAQLHAANEFLLRLRCEMHFGAGRPQDGLGRSEQVRLAGRFGYPGSEGVLPVEELMRDYFRLTSQVRHIAELFSAAALARRTLAQSMLAPLFTRQVEEQFRISLNRIGFDPLRLAAARSDISQILRLVQLSALHDRAIEPESFLAIREAMLEAPADLTPEAAQQFWALLATPRRLAESLQTLHEMHVLEKIVPAMQHARGLLQFNEYHHYTVDEHSLRAIRICTGFARDPGVVGRTYNNLRDPQVLHLALLLHDLGKGFAEEHCEVGQRLAVETCRRLGLTGEETEQVRFLVHNHLMMSHVAFHRDISDESMVAEFAANVGSVHLLSHLFLLTCADISAVAPDMMTPWKSELLTALFLNAHDQLTGRALRARLSRHSDRLFDRIAAVSGDDPLRSAWLREIVPNLPWSYCSENEPARVADQLLQLRMAGPEDVLAWINPVARTGQYELCIAKRERIRAGIFYKVTGMLASQGLQVQAAEVKPLGHSLLWYWFRFEDGEHAESPPSRMEEIRRQALAIARGEEWTEPRFRATWHDRITPAMRMSLPELRVEIDNQTVDSATIIDVFAWNRLGLLYTIGRRLFLLGLDIRFARISTWGHQVLDVFYVTDGTGMKIRDRFRLRTIRDELRGALASFLEEPAEQEQGG